MSADGKLGDRKRAREERRLGEPVLMAFASHPFITLVTPDDRHFIHDTEDDTIEQIDPRKVTHWNTCPVNQHLNL